MEAGTSKWRGMCDGGAALKHHRLPPSLPPAVARPRGNRYRGGAEVHCSHFLQLGERPELRGQAAAKHVDSQLQGDQRSERPELRGQAAA